MDKQPYYTKIDEKVKIQRSTDYFPFLLELNANSYCSTHCWGVSFVANSSINATGTSSGFLNLMHALPISSFFDECFGHSVVNHFSNGVDPYRPM